METARAAIDLGSCRIVNIKLQRVGGFLEALRIIELCASRGVPVWMGTMPELGVGSGAGARARLASLLLVPDGRRAERPLGTPAMC